MSDDPTPAACPQPQGSLILLLFGLAVSIPLIVWSSQIILRWMERWPWIVLIVALRRTKAPIPQAQERS